MTNEEILQKAIEKAVKNGYDREECSWAINEKGKMWDTAWLQNIIFSHSFAKAFFGKWNLKNPDYPDKLEDEYGVPYLTKWQYHLQQMVLEENPIEYLAKFLKGK